MQGKVSSKHDAAPSVYVGVAVCKEWLDIHIHPQGHCRRLSNEKSGIVS